MPDTTTETTATPTGGKTMSKTKTDNLAHAAGCKGERVEIADYPDRGLSAAHCIDCGAHEATDRSGNTLTTPAVTGGLVGSGRGNWDVSMETTGGAA